MEKAHGVLLLLIFTLFAGSAVWLKLALSGGDGSGHAIKTPAWLAKSKSGDGKIEIGRRPRRNRNRATAKSKSGDGKIEIGRR